MPLVLGTDYFGSTVSRERSMQLMDHYLDAGGNVDSLQFGTGAPNIDFAANAASLGALSEKVTGIPGLEAALTRARAANRTYLICIETDDTRITKEGGWWWEVAVPEESPSESARRVAPLICAEKRTKNDNESAHQTLKGLPTDCLCDTRLGGLALHHEWMFSAA